MQTNYTVCQHPGCYKTLVRRQRLFCSKSHAAHGTQSWTYKKIVEPRISTCKICGLETHYKLAMCSEECRLESRRRAVLEFCEIDGKTIKSAFLKRRLIETGILDASCLWCGITEWRGKPAPLELDHINGNNKDNRLINLRILCANCHAQTDTYCGRNIKFNKGS